MTLYNVQPQFVERVERGEKFTTMRPDRRGAGHARVGGLVQIYTHLRTRRARRVGESVCVLRAPVLIDGDGVRTCLPLDVRDSSIAAKKAAFAWRCRDLAEIARFDGFDRWSDLADFMLANHGREPWSLNLVGWEPLGQLLGPAAAA